MYVRTYIRIRYSISRIIHIIVSNCTLYRYKMWNFCVRTQDSVFIPLFRSPARPGKQIPAHDVYTFIL